MVLECRTARKPLPRLGEDDLQIRALLSPVNPADVRPPVFSRLAFIDRPWTAVS